MLPYLACFIKCSDPATESNPCMRPTTIKRFAPLALLVLLMIAVYASGLHRTLTLNEIQNHKLPLLNYANTHPFIAAILFIAGYAGAVALSLPVATLLTLLGGFLFGAWLGTLYVVLGATAGATAIFLIARGASGAALRDKAGPLYAKIECNMRENAVGYMLFMRLVPLFPFFLVNIVPALFNVPLRAYVLTTFIGIMPGTFVYVNLGTALGDIDSLDDLGSPQTLIAFTLLGLFALAPVLYKKLRKKMAETLNVDLCVIGAGAAGLSVAAGAAQLGLNVALVEKNRMGGDCLNTGCVPSKALLAAAKAAHNIRKADIFGIGAPEPVVDFSAVKDYVRGVIRVIEPHDSVERFEGLGVNVIKGAARFKNDKAVSVGSQTIGAKYFVIATGSRAVLPPVRGLDARKTLTHETIFDLREKPEHLIIIGGGPVGMEMAQAHRRLGCKVTVLDIGPVLPKDDPAFAAIVRAALEAEGVHIIGKTSIREIEYHDNVVTVHIEKNGHPSTIKGSHILAAAGRLANVDGLGLENAGIAFNQKGIHVDARLRTRKKHIFAAGDIAGGPQFTHVAGYHAGIIIRNIVFKLPAKVDYTALPWVTYTDPELAQVGMTEAAAKEKHGAKKIKTALWKMKENDRAQAEHRTDGMIKVIMLNNGRIIGATLAGAGAGELTGLWSLAISQKMKIGAIAGLMVPYPTLGEISKRAAGAYFIPSLFSNRTRGIVQFLQKLPV